MTYQVITSTGSATPAGPRFIRATPMALAILRAGVTVATFLDTTPVSVEMRAMYRAMVGVMKLVSVAAVGSDGLYTFNVQTPDGGTLRTSDGPIAVTLPTSAMSR